MLIIVIYFANENMKQQTFFFVLKKIHERYIDENMITMILITFDEYEIRNFLDYFVMNNAKSNDIIIKILSKTFKKTTLYTIQLNINSNA